MSRAIIYTKKPDRAAGVLSSFVLCW